MRKKNTKNKTGTKGKSLGIYLAVNLAVAVGGSMVTTAKIPYWYNTLIKPDFAPPNWLFGPVWTILYIMMAIAAFKADEKKANMTWYWVQLGMNFIWSWVFFGWENPGIALGVIGGLWLAIATCMRYFELKSKYAAWLMVPYFLWVSFASILNYAIWRLN